MNPKTLAKILSFIALMGTLLPSILLFYGLIGLDAAKSAMLVATVAWFIATPYWMGRKQAASPPAE